MADAELGPTATVELDALAAVTDGLLQEVLLVLEPDLDEKSKRREKIGGVLKQQLDPDDSAEDMIGGVSVEMR